MWDLKSEFELELRFLGGFFAVGTQLLNMPFDFDEHMSFFKGLEQDLEMTTAPPACDSPPYVTNTHEFWFSVALRVKNEKKSHRKVTENC